LRQKKQYTLNVYFDPSVLWTHFIPQWQTNNASGNSVIPYQVK